MRQPTRHFTPCRLFLCLDQFSQVIHDDDLFIPIVAMGQQCGTANAENFLATLDVNYNFLLPLLIFIQVRLHGIEKWRHHRVLLHNMCNGNFGKIIIIDIKNQAGGRVPTFNKPGFIDRQYTRGNVLHYRFQVVSL